MDFRRSKSSSKSKPTFKVDREAKLFSWATGKSGVGEGRGGGDNRYSNLYYDLIPGAVSPSKERDQQGGLSSQVSTTSKGRNDDDSVVVVSPLFNPDTTSSVKEANEKKKKDSDGSSSSDEKEDLWAQWGVVRQGNIPLADAGRRDNSSSSTSGLSTSVQTKKTNQARSRSDKYKSHSSLLDDDAVVALHEEDSAHRRLPLLDLNSLTSSPPKSVKLPPSPSPSKPPNASSKSHHPAGYAINIGGVERSSGVTQPRSLIETERTRQSRTIAVASHKADDSSSRIVRY